MSWLTLSVGKLAPTLKKVGIALGLVAMGVATENLAENQLADESTLAVVELLLRLLSS